MKLAVIFAFLPLPLLAQTVKENRYDNFLKKQRIEISPVVVHSTPGKKLAVAFSSVGNDLYLHLNGLRWGAATIDAGNELIFLFTNDSTVTVRSTGVQTFEHNLAGSTYRHQYRLTPQALEAFATYSLAGVRKYSFKEHADLLIPASFQNRLQKVSALFLDELKRSHVIKTLIDVAPKDIAAHVGDSVRICSRVYSSRYYENSENKPTVLDLQSGFDDPLVNVVIMEENRRQFPAAPEKAYLNKELCVTGVVLLRNNVPYIAVQSRSQLKLQSPPSLEEVALWLGDTVTVGGIVSSARYLAETSSAPTLLNLGAAFPNQLLTVVIEKADRPAFGEKPETFYLNKEISVSGQVVLFKGKPQIVVRNPAQLKVLNDNVVTTAVHATDGQAFGPSFAGTAPAAADEPELPAAFPGGDEAWVAFLKKNLRIPPDMEANENKTVVVSFYVHPDGLIGDKRIAQSAGTVYDKEVMRVLELMPKWKPKRKGLTPLGVVVSQPITFRKEIKDQP